MGRRSARPLPARLRRRLEIIRFCLSHWRPPRFIRIGTSPPWSLEAARARAKLLRSSVDQGRDPACENRGREISPVEDLIQYIAENLVKKA
jgi:hypothetical protein